MMYVKVVIFAFVMSCAVFAQTGFKILPAEIRFTDEFHRLENVYFVNDGHSPVSIDSIYYKKSLYYVRFDRPWQYPFVINPGDTVLMDCILSKYYLVTNEDINDTMFVYLENKQLIKISIKIDFYNSKIYMGKISGDVLSGNSLLTDATVYFYRDGKFLFDSVNTDISGHYEAWLPEGSYTISAENKLNYLSFFNNQPSPLNPRFVNVNRSSESLVNLNLRSISFNGFSISGIIRDKTSFGILKRAIIIARKGIHNASKNNDQFISEEGDEVYSGVVNTDGVYKISVPTYGYYSVQGFSDYYLPGYFAAGNTSILWQDADSIYVDSEITNKNLFFTRDSSFGAGIIKGRVYIPSQPDSQIRNVIILVKTVDNNSFISYCNVEANGNFQVTNLPYGNYKLIAQKIGLEDASSIIITIDPTNNIRENVSISLSTSVSDEDKPNQFFLGQNYPNPFNPSTNFKFGIANFGFVSLKVYDILGNEVSTLINEYKAAGNYEINFNAGNLSTGIYFYQLKVGQFVQTRKMIYLK